MRGVAMAGHDQLGASYSPRAHVHPGVRASLLIQTHTCINKLRSYPPGWQDRELGWGLSIGDMNIAGGWGNSGACRLQESRRPTR